MKIYLIIVIFFVLSAYRFDRTNTIPLKNLSGTYEGLTSQDIGNQEVFYKTILNIKAGKNEKVKGKSVFYAHDDSTQVLVEYNFEGIYDNKSQILKLKEYEIVKKTKNLSFCFKEMPLKCITENGKIELRGLWSAKNCPDTGGKIRVIKQK